MNGLKWILWTSVFLFSFNTTTSFAAGKNIHFAKQRIIYQQATKALQTNQIGLFQTLRSQLDDYPLQPYLDYLYLRHRLSQADKGILNQFLTTQSNTFYAHRLRSAWLDRLAKTKQWQLYLTQYKQPQSVSRQCLRLQALIALNQYEQVLQEATALWLVAKSQPKVCDPAFALLKKEGMLTDELVWQRIHLALTENQYSLAAYLAKQLSKPTEATAKISQWQKMHNKPLASLQSLTSKAINKSPYSLEQDTNLSREIIKHGIERLTRKSTAQAYAQWQRIAPLYSFSEQDKWDVQGAIGKRSALRRENSTLTYFGDTPNEHWRARAALWQQDWPAAQKAILSLDNTEQYTSRWQYWLARSLAEQGHHEVANDIFQSLVMDRDYYSFLAADKLGQPYQMNHNPISTTALELDEFAQRPEVMQLKEFHALNMKTEARRQAYYMKQRYSSRDLQLLATFTHQWGWHNQTIAVLGSAKYWDALDLRFPVLFDKSIVAAGKANNVDASWLFGVARQESAFDPHARSRVGASGLMQLMPKTATLVAKLIKQPLKNMSELLKPNRNIQLGSAYLSQMYTEKQNNPVLATASYNAGPHRVTKWMPKKTMPADVWIENIPFNETRKYTSNVLSYAAVFDYQRKQAIVPLSNRMPAIKPKKP